MPRAAGPGRAVDRLAPELLALAAVTVATLLTGATVGCAGEADPSERAARAIVYGADDRREYFELASPGERATMAASMVALIPAASIRRAPQGIVAEAPSWGDRDGLCPGERFAEQPAAAFCSGVLVDWDLVLTAGHCVRVLAPQDLRVVFGYYYVAPGRLAATEADVMEVSAIASEALDPASAEPRLDYAWLRLRRPVSPPLAPAPVHVRAPALTPGDPVVSIGAGGGVPMKADAGGRVRGLRAPWLDYFLADTDTSGGSSGGGGFDQQLSLLGILVRGGADASVND
jgi:hypothetical protein